MGIFLDAIGVPLPGSEAGKFVGINPKKSQVVSRLFRLWSAHVPETSVTGFLGRLFSEDPKGRSLQFRKFWTPDFVTKLDPVESKSLASFVLPGQAVYTSGMDARKRLLSLLDEEEVVGLNNEVDASVNADTAEGERNDANKLSTSLGDFRELNINDKPRRSAEKNSKLTNRKKKKAKEAFDHSTDESSDEEEAHNHDREVPEDDSDFEDDFSALSPKFRHIIRQGGPGFAEFFTPLTLEVTTKPELYKALE